MISRRRHEDGRLQGSVNPRSSPSATTDSLRRISIRVRADRNALDRFSHVILGRRVPSQTASLFVLRDRLVGTEDAVVDVLVVNRACPTRQMRLDRLRDPVFDL